MIKGTFRRVFVAVTSLVFAIAFEGGHGFPSATPRWTAPALRAGGRPLSFEVNAGQTDQRVRFLSRSAGGTLFLTPDEAVLSLHAGGPERSPGRPPATGAGPGVLRMRLLGGSVAPRLVGLDAQPGRSHYLVGADPRGWRRGIPQYARVKYEDVYPGVDLIFHGREGRLEYDLVVAPGTDPDVIRIGFHETGRLRLDDRGNLIVPVGGDEVVQHAPLIYQEIGGARSVIAGRFVLRGAREVGFEVSGTYDPARPLVIDPVLSYSTYLGGTGSDLAMAIAVDGSGSVYVTGQTFSSDFPTRSAIQPTRAGAGDVFVTKLTPTARRLSIPPTSAAGDTTEAGASRWTIPASRTSRAAPSRSTSRSPTASSRRAPAAAPTPSRTLSWPNWRRTARRSSIPPTSAAIAPTSGGRSRSTAPAAPT